MRDCMRKLLVVIILISTLYPFGCINSESSYSNESWKIFVDNNGGFSFQYPSSWSVEDLPDNGGILLLCPKIEDRWQAYAHFEFGEDRESRPMNKRIKDLIPNYKSRKAEFQLMSSEVATHSSGLIMGRFDFTQVSKGTKLSNSEILIEFEKDKVLFVSISTSSKVADKYQPILEKVLGSIKKI